MPDPQYKMPQNDFAKLSAAIVSDIKRHVASLRQSDVDVYGYASLPPDYYASFDPTTFAVAFNRESDIDPSKRGEPYYRYCVDEWQNYVHEGFDAVNGELKRLLEANRLSADDSIDDAFVKSVYEAVLNAMLTLRKEHTFDGVPFVVVWLSGSDDDIVNRSAKMLNSPTIYSEFATEFGE